MDIPCAPVVRMCGSGDFVSTNMYVYCVSDRDMLGGMEVYSWYRSSCCACFVCLLVACVQSVEDAWVSSGFRRCRGHTLRASGEDVWVRSL